MAWQKIDPHSLQIQALRRADGLLISNYWVNSGAMSAHNEMMFGGQGGLTIVRPERLQEWRYQPPVVLTDLRVGGKSLATGPYQKNLGQAGIGDSTGGQ